MKNQNVQLSYFSYVFQAAVDSGLGCQVVIMEHFCVDCIPSIPLKHFDRGLMSDQAKVNLSMIYHQYETLKTSFWTWRSTMTTWP